MVICLVFTNTVDRGVLFHTIVDCCTKLLPITVSTNGLVWLVVMLVGATDAREGVGKFTC